MKAKVLVRGWVPWTVSLVGVMGLLVQVPLPVVGQKSPPASPAQSDPDQLGEARRLELQVVHLYEQGKYSAAIPLEKRVLAIREKVLGPEHPYVATDLNNLALLYRLQGNYKQAKPLFQRALAIREKVLGPEHPYVATSLNNLAVLYTDQGNYKQAEPLYQRALTITEKVLGPEHPEVARSLNNLAFLYRNQGNYKQAEPLYQRALAIYEKALGPEHPDVATSLNGMAQLYWASGDVPRAIEFLTRNVNIEEHNLTQTLTTGSEEMKRAYIINTLSDTTNITVSLHVQAAPNNQQAARLALTTILRRKGRVLDALTSSLLSLRQHLKPEDQALLDQLIALRSQLSALVFKGSGNTPPDQYRQQLTSLEDQAQKLEAELSRRSDEFRTQSQPVTLEAVQKLIPTDAALVELVLYRPWNPKANLPGEKWGASRYVAYVLHSQGDPQWVDLGEAEPIDKAMQEFRQAIQRDPIKSARPYLGERKLSGAQIKQIARSLDEKLMQPIRQHLGSTRKLLLSPDSQLNLIPFAALVDENNHYLVENYSISYLTSGRDLLRQTTHFPSQQSPVVLANPDFEHPGQATSVQIASGSRGLENQRSTDLAQLQFGHLEGTAKEATAITPLLPGVKVLTGSLATENALKALHGPSILHIATDGFFLSAQPPAQVTNTGPSTAMSLPGALPNSALTTKENPLLRSGLALAGANLRSSGGDDGILTAFEAAGLDLRGTKLVVLSACETGLGDVANGEGVYGLRRALAIAGAESQVISLWKVDDEQTKDLMVGYYQQLRNNVGRSEALRQIQLRLLHSQQYQYPYYWAAFIASGDWTPMRATSTLGR